MLPTQALYPPTHEVTNQVVPLENYNVFTGNQVLRDALKFNAPDLDRLAAVLPTRVEHMATEIEARRLAQDVALAVQAAILYQSAPMAVFSAFCDSRLGGDWGYTFGTLGAAVDFDTILARAMPR